MRTPWGAKGRGSYACPAPYNREAQILAMSLGLTHVTLRVQDITGHSAHPVTTRNAHLHSVESSTMRDYLD